MAGSHQLSSDLDYWQVVLTDGSTITLRAHAYGEDGDDLVFVALMAGTPPYEHELARLPKSAVQNVQGGWTQLQ